MSLGKPFLLKQDSSAERPLVNIVSEEDLLKDVAFSEQEKGYCVVTKTSYPSFWSVTLKESTDVAGFSVLMDNQDDSPMEGAIVYVDVQECATLDNL